MKKFNRVLAAAIAVPVAMGQVLAISSSAAVKPDAAQITADKLLYVNPESEIKDGKQVSDWNTRMAGYVKDVNGEYSVDAKSIVEGLSGTGKYTSLVKDIVSASANPTLTVKDGKVTAKIVWSSKNYDYMKVGDTKYDAVIEDEHSTFEIPVSCFDWAMAVKADTTAMSEAHEIDYTLTFDSASVAPLSK